MVLNFNTAPSQLGSKHSQTLKLAVDFFFSMPQVFCEVLEKVPFEMGLNWDLLPKIGEKKRYSKPNRFTAL